MFRVLKASVLTGAMLGAAASTATAQAGGVATNNIIATANVFQAITLTGERGLDFGNVFPGVDKTVALNAATSGKFSALGQANAPVNMTFTLPANLSVSGNNLPINSWSACVSSTANQVDCGTSFVPSLTPNAASFSGLGVLSVFIGARVQPSASQPAGTYTGTITMTLAYVN